LVLHTRVYRARDVIPALIRLGFTTAERALDNEAQELLEQLRPDLLVLMLDPARERDIRALRVVTGRSRAFVLVIGPGSATEGFAEALRAGADACLREVDSVATFEAQLTAFVRRQLTPVRPAQPAEGTGVLEFDDLVIEPAAHQVRFRKQLIAL